LTEAPEEWQPEDPLVRGRWQRGRTRLRNTRTAHDLERFSGVFGSITSQYSLLYLDCLAGWIVHQQDGS
jgi:hypothetical protein